MTKRESVYVSDRDSVPASVCVGVCNDTFQAKPQTLLHATSEPRHPTVFCNPVLLVIAHEIQLNNLNRAFSDNSLDFYILISSAYLTKYVLR